MHTGRFVFAELIAHLSHKEFQKCVTRYDGDHHDRTFSCWDQYLAMAFAQSLIAKGCGISKRAWGRCRYLPWICRMSKKSRAAAWLRMRTSMTNVLPLPGQINQPAKFAALRIRIE